MENNIRLGWATVEVNNPDCVMEKSGKLLVELRILKKDKGLDYAFLTVVDLVKKQSDLLCCGWREVELAKAAFGGPTRAPQSHEKLVEFVSLCMKDEDGTMINKNFKLEEACMNLGGKTSRKKEFIPPVQALLNSGWKPSTDALGQNLERMLTPAVLTSHMCEDKGCTLVRKFSRVSITAAEFQVVREACQPCK